MFNLQMATQFKNMDTESNRTNIALQNDLIIGQQLPDYTLIMKINMFGIAINMDVQMIDRYMIAQENVNTPTRTYECYVIAYTTQNKIGMNRAKTGKRWIAKGVGLVKKEGYNGRGRVTSSSELTDFF